MILISSYLAQVPVEHGLLIENLLDLAHAPFTHVTTFAKGWPIPPLVKFNTSSTLEGNWEPYPIDMSFGPPCMTFSMIGGQALWAIVFLILFRAHTAGVPLAKA